ncbi:hypothetical protein ACS0TY_023483 [Phlomoides rotata]
MRMRGWRLQRFVFLPFSIRCDSESSVALAVSLSPKQSKTTREKDGEENLKMDKNQSLSKASFTQGLNRLIRRFKTFSHFFAMGNFKWDGGSNRKVWGPHFIFRKVYKEEMEYMEKEMEIGFPTDVKHVTHIGSDGSTTINQVSNWGNNLKASEILSFPSISLQQFEIAMAAQSHS